MRTDGVPVKAWCAPREIRAIERELGIISAQAGVRAVAVMADAHPGLRVPNGIVVASEGVLYPELIGADIGCGYATARFTPLKHRPTSEALEAALAVIKTVIPSILRPQSLPSQECTSESGATSLSAGTLASEARRNGRLQSGTLGRGNHFIELDLDEAGRAWIVVHSGSRGMGQAIFRHHAGVSAASNGAKRGLISFDAESPPGKAFWSDMEWALRYARENRRAILERASEAIETILGATIEPESLIDCPHNFARKEIYDGRECIVHRKSANSALGREAGVICGDMASGARIVRGLGSPEALRSSSHGAGRAMSRTEAFSRISKPDFLGIMRGIVFDYRHERLLRDEAPQAYRDLDKVMRVQRDLVSTVERLKPIMNDKRP